MRVLAAGMMRNILVDHARKRAARLDHERVNVTFGQGGDGLGTEPIDLLAVEEALRELAKLHERQGRVVELRFFGGLEVEEVAMELGVSVRTVVNDWRMARAWLSRELRGGGTS